MSSVLPNQINRSSGLTYKNTKEQHIPSHRKRQFTLSLLCGLLFLTCVISLGIGAVNISPYQVMAIIVSYLGIETAPGSVWEFTHSQQIVLESIRLPRLLLGLLVGSTLAVCGASMQGLFRNPLADPALLGISSGAALAVVATIVLQSTLLQGFNQIFGLFTLPVAAFIGGFIVTWLVYRFASCNGQLNISSLLLAGIAINALAGSATGLLVYLADDQQLRTLTFWSMGSLSSATWPQVISSLPFFLITLILIPFLSIALNAMLLGEAEAGHLGFPVEKIKTTLIILVALGVGAAVAFSGIIGFIGLVVPHLIRLWLGPDHRGVIPGSLLLGACLLLLSDLLARSLVTPAELPIGIITGLLGGPFFLWLLHRQKIIGTW